MNKKLLILAAVTLFTGFFLVTGYAAAEDPLSRICEGHLDPSDLPAACTGTATEPLFGPSGIITRATQIVSAIVGVAAVIMIMVGGFKYVTSTGDPNSVNSAKNTILYAVVGIAVAASAQIIVIYVMRRL